MLCIIAKNSAMKLFGLNITRRSDIDDKVDNAVRRVLLGVDDAGRIAVTEKESMSLSAVWACVRIITNSVGILPLHLYERTDKGRKKVYDHPAAALLREPNECWSTFDLTSWLLTYALLWGNGYCRIVRDRVTYLPVRLDYYESEGVNPVMGVDHRLRYRLPEGELVDASDMIHIKGVGTDPLKGMSVIAKHRENIALSMEAQTYGERFFSKGGNTSGVFTLPGVLKKEQYDRLKADLTARTVGVANSHAPLLLEGGMEYKRINIPLNDAQFIETRKYQSSEIAAIFGVPVHMLGNLDKATYNNTELQGIEYVTYCLMPWLRKLEAEFNRKLLREDEKSRYYFSFSVNGLMRADAKSRSEFYKNMTLIGAMNANEVREMEDMNAYDAGDKYFVQLNMTPADKAGETQE